MYAQLNLVFSTLLVLNLARADEDFKFKIGMPEYICDKDGEVKDVNNDMTKIRLLGSDAQSLSYKFEVNYRRIGNNCQNYQRCALIAWKAVRQLHDYLENYPVTEIKSGVIEISNAMLMPGLQYILNVTVSKGDQTIEQKILTLDYVNDDVKKSVPKPMASILLLGPDTVYPHMSFVLNANSVICSNISHYYWKMLDGDDTLIDFNEKSAELVIPGDSLQALKTYTIDCKMVNSDDKSVIANSVQNINTLSKGLALQVPVKSFHTVVNQAVKVAAFMRDLDNMDGDLDIKWTCVELGSKEECNYESSSNSNELESDAFSTSGRYEIGVEIAKNGHRKTDSCTIEVTDNAPFVEVEQIDSPINPCTEFTIRVKIYRLRTFCTLQWSVQHEEGYQDLDLSSVPGNVAELVNVTLKEDLFLFELEDFTNGTVDKNHDLTIPPKTGQWPGLIGDVKYWFRLTTKCPPDENSESDMALMTDIVIETNAPPQIRPLEVKPTTGEAFVTRFSYKTQRADDKEGDGPILYKFGYSIKNRDFVMVTLTDVTSAELLLPVSQDEGVRTFLECCDNFDSCDRVMGPVITTGKPGEAYFANVLMLFSDKLLTEEYYKAFAIVVGILQTYTGRQEEVIRFVNLKINEVIQEFLALERDDGNGWIWSANKLVKTMSDFRSDVQPDSTTLSNLKKLRDKLSERQQSIADASVGPIRKLLSAKAPNKDHVTLQDVKNFLDLAELIIKSSNDTAHVAKEREVLRLQLKIHMKSLCKGLKTQNNLQLEADTVLLGMEKLVNINANKNGFVITIPFERNSWNVTAKLKLDFNRNVDYTNVCIGKAVFRDGHLSKNSTIFLADVMDTEWDAKAARVTIVLPMTTPLNNPQCVVYNGNSWQNDCKVLQVVKSQYVKCSCNYLGYFCLENSNELVTTSTKSPPTTSSYIETVTQGLATTTQKIERTSEEVTTHPTVSLLNMSTSHLAISDTESSSEILFLSCKRNKTRQGKSQVLKYKTRNKFCKNFLAN